MQISSGALYRSEQIRQAERVAIEFFNIPGFQLMQRAGRAAFDALSARWPQARSIQVLCGSGNNGGDGYVIACLAMQAGWQVSLQSVVDPVSLQGDAMSACQAFIAAGGTVSNFVGEMGAGEIVVDALLGTGLNRPVSECYAQAIKAINAANRPVLAVDVPSGLHADTGAVMGGAVKADLTVTFIALKTGLFTGQSADCCGDIVLATLDVPDAVMAGLHAAAQLIQPVSMPRRPRAAHKGCFGHVLLIGGNAGYTGAIRLAGEAALRAGAGLVSVATRRGHETMLNLGRPELMCHAVEQADQLALLLEKASVIAIGPGLGQDAWANEMLTQALSSEKCCVIDADALNLLSRQPQTRSNWVLTPHPGEAARLLACTRAEVTVDRYAAIRRMQQSYGGVCLLKGAGTLVADEAQIFVATTGNPGMAGGGMGDVLTGLVAALLAQGLTMLDAAKLAVHVHGAAADLVADEFGERGLLASDILPNLRRLLN